MTPQHTPGPWIVLPWYARNGSEIITIQAVNRTVADCPGNDALAKANAQLIASAPEMLSALERLVSIGEKLQSGKRGGEVMGVLSLLTDEARAIVAKAKGNA